MNRKLISFFLCLFVCFNIACSDANETGPKSVPPVSEITYESEPGKIHFRWSNPKIQDLAYVEIQYKNVADELCRVLVNGKSEEQLIYGLGTDAENDYAFRAFDVYENCSEVVHIKASSDVPPFAKVMETVNVLVNLQGVEVRWDNVYSGEYYVNLNYRDALGVFRNHELVINETGAGRRQVNIDGVLAADLSVTVSDEYKNTSEPKVFAYKKLEYGKFDRNIWRITDFSSEEAGGEGAFPQGYTAALIDGQKNTFWHSKWKDLPAGYQPGFPQHVTFDLQRKVQLDSAEFIQRHNKAMAGEVELAGSNISSNGPWKVFKVATLKGNTAGGVDMVLFDDPVLYRYVKMTVTKKGVDAKFAGLAEFSLFGQDLIEEE